LNTPAAVPVTFMLIVQDPRAASEPPVIEIEPLPGAALTVPEHVAVRPFGVDTVRPAGRASVNPTPVRPEAFGLLSANVSDVDPFLGIDAAPNALAIDGVVATLRVAEAELPVPPFAEVTGDVVFVNVPAPVAVTVTLN